MTPKLKSFVISLLRKGTFKWTPRTTTKLKARVLASDHPEFKDLGRTIYLYKCAICGKLYKDKEVVVDHIEPVVPIEGYKSGLEFDLNEYVERMFCEEENFQVICEICHDKKTERENEQRNSRKASAKTIQESKRKVKTPRKNKSVCNKSSRRYVRKSRFS